MSKPKRLNCLAIRLIETYRKPKSPIGSGHCKYYPTCSQYGLEAYTKFSFVKASFLTLWRILRCNPLARGGFFPPPFNKKKKTPKKNQKRMKHPPQREKKKKTKKHPHAKNTKRLKKGEKKKKPAVTSIS